MSDLIAPDTATEAQIEAFVASVREDAQEHVRELLIAGASEVEVAEFIASLEPLSDAVPPNGGERDE